MPKISIHIPREAWMSEYADTIWPAGALFTYGGSMTSPFPKKIQKNFNPVDADVELVTDASGRLLYLNLPPTDKNLRLLDDFFPRD